MLKVLIIGRLPPPVGGVTSHVSRLIENLEIKGFSDFTFLDLKAGAPNVLLTILRHRVLHLHISNPFWQLCLAFVCRAMRKRLIVTFHGNWGRYGTFGNLTVALACRLAYIPIVQNKESYEKAILHNSNAQMVSTYLKSGRVEPLNQNLANQVFDFKAKYNRIVCTNAWNVAIDQFNREIYGISSLIEWIEAFKDTGLIISDPSGNYVNKAKQMYSPLPPNILFLSVPHDFRQVLTASDVFIRNTTTDGVSLSICEALDLNIPVFASNTVSRPERCFVYNRLEEIDLGADLASARTLLLKKACAKCAGQAIDQIISIYQTALVS